MDNARSLFRCLRLLTTRLGIVAWLGLIVSGCATTKELDTLRTQVNEEVSAVRADAAQSRQAVEALKADVTLLKSLGAAVDVLKNRLDGLQAAVQTLHTEGESYRTTLDHLRDEFKVEREGMAKETDRLRMSVGSMEKGMMHQIQTELTLARERVKQLEQVTESLQKSSSSERGKEGAAMPKP